MSFDPHQDPFGPGGPSAGAFESPPPRQRKPRLWLHVLLFVATAYVVTFMGGLFYCLHRRGTTENVAGFLTAVWGDHFRPDAAIDFAARLTVDQAFLFSGMLFSIPLLTVLLAHEMGHYLAARRHGLEATLPFFLPMPIPFLFSPGTLGAVIRIRDPILDRRQLLDVGAWGPLAGFAATLPILIGGVALSGVAELDPEGGLYYFGEPLLFRLVARVLFFPDLAPGMDLALHPAAWAAWWGLFVTALNMLPLAQLDGGHVAYALFGRRHQRLVWWLWAALLPLGLLWPGWWLWAVIVAVMKPTHPPVWREHVELDPARRRLGWLALAIFVLCFSPVPIRIVLGG